MIFGPAPAQNDSYETRLVALRAAEQAFVANLGDSAILFCNFGNSFDRTVNANYAASETLVAGVHLRDAGLRSNGPAASTAIRGCARGSLLTFRACKARRPDEPVL